MHKLQWHDSNGAWKAKCGKILMFEVFWDTASDPKGSNLPPYRVISHLKNITMQRYRSVEDAQHQCSRAFQLWLDAAGLQ